MDWIAVDKNITTETLTHLIGCYAASEAVDMLARGEDALVASAPGYLRRRGWSGIALGYRHSPSESGPNSIVVGGDCPLRGRDIDMIPGIEDAIDAWDLPRIWAALDASDDGARDDMDQA